MVPVCSQNVPQTSKPEVRRPWFQKTFLTPYFITSLLHCPIFVMKHSYSTSSAKLFSCSLLFVSVQPCLCCNLGSSLSNLGRRLLVTVSQGLLASGGGFNLLPGKCYTNWKYVEVILVCFLCVVAKVQVGIGRLIISYLLFIKEASVSL